MGCAYAQKCFKTLLLIFIVQLKRMKKAEQQQTPFTPLAVTNGATKPMAPANQTRQNNALGHADPSSTFRSSRYPVPSFEYRTAAAQ